MFKIQFMHWIFSLIRFFPYWALPLVLMGFETGVYYKRRNRKKSQFICWGVSGVLMVSICIWFLYRGDVHSDRWVQSFLNNFSS
jgi:hypothetical protein